MPEEQIGAKGDRAANNDWRCVEESASDFRPLHRTSHSTLSEAASSKQMGNEDKGGLRAEATRRLTEELLVAEANGLE